MTALRKPYTRPQVSKTTTTLQAVTAIVAVSGGGSGSVSG